jgi:predicted metal-dependent peptidase
METTDEDKVARLLALKRMAVMRKTPPFPGIKHSNKFTILYIVDTSGSMSVKDMQLGLAQLQHIQKSDSDIKIIVMYVDAAVAKEYEIGPNDELDTNMAGRGGTDFEPAILRAKELLSTQDKAPDIVIYCTDGYCPPPKTQLPVPIVWLITPNGQVPDRRQGNMTLQMKDYELGESYE